MPQRTCVGCRRVRAQAELVRVRRTADGRLDLTSGKRGSGRSAYLCPDPACLTAARKRRAIERALSGELPPDDWAALEAGILMKASGGVPL